MNELTKKYYLEFRPHAATKDVTTLVGPFINDLTDDQVARV